MGVWEGGWEFRFWFSLVLVYVVWSLFYFFRFVLRVFRILLNGVISIRV